jgi:hypothetical protein
MTLKRRSSIVLLALFAALAGLTVISRTQPAARAGTDCIPQCGQVINNGPSGGDTVTALHNWCGSESTERLYGSQPCAASYGYRTLHPGQSTTATEDWDGFAIAGGCTGYVVMYWWNTFTWTWDLRNSYPVDRRGTNAMWIRIHNDEQAHVSQNC